MAAMKRNSKPRRADCALVPVRKAHLRRAEAESRRRKAAKQPRKFTYEVIDDALSAGLGAVVPIRRRPAQQPATTETNSNEERNTVCQQQAE